jgi:hypothetical protein
MTSIETLAPTLFPMAPSGIRWRPNVPSHGQRDWDKTLRTEAI